MASNNLDTQLAAIPTKTEMDAAITAIILTPTERNAVADALLDRAGAVDSKTVRQALRYMAAVVSGKVSGAGTGTEVFKGLDGSTTRITVTADEDGNRTGITYDA
jgi:hypothetical protein